MFKKGADTKGKSDVIFKEWVDQRRKSFDRRNVRKKPRDPIATINPPGRGRQKRPVGAPRVPDKGYRISPDPRPRKPTHMPRWEHMPGRGRRLLP